MGHRYVVLGAGMQGTAAGYDLVTHGEATALRVLDRDLRLAEAAAARLRELTGHEEIAAGSVDAGDPAALAHELEAADGVFSAVPYGFNPVVTEAAIVTGTHACDLGGNTGVVLDQLDRDEAARAAGISVVPDCGIAPGFANVLAAHAVAEHPEVQHVHIRCGGLPQTPKPPLDYKLVFNIGGLTNEYTGEAEFLRNGRRITVPAFTELETLDLPDPVGACEAFVTSGGTSTGPRTFEGRLATYDYKTVRYPGHWEKFRAIVELGLLDEEPVSIGDVKVSPREVFHTVAAPKLDHPGDRDLLVLRVDALDEEERRVLRFDLVDSFDETTNFTAMERCTAFPAAATLHLQVSGRVSPGVGTSERIVPTAELIDAVHRRGLLVRVSRS